MRSYMQMRWARLSAWPNAKLCIRLGLCEPLAHRMGGGRGNVHREFGRIICVYDIRHALLIAHTQIELLSAINVMWVFYAIHNNV